MHPPGERPGTPISPASTTLPPSHPTLYALVAHAARRCSDGQLVACTALGLIGSLATAFPRPRWVVLLSALAALAAFGAWGVLDRMRTELAAGSHTPARLSWFPQHLVRILLPAVAALGTLAALATLFGITGLCLGTWIS
jgi:hypothetical protein